MVGDAAPSRSADWVPRIGRTSGWSPGRRGRRRPGGRRLRSARGWRRGRPRHRQARTCRRAGPRPQGCAHRGRPPERRSAAADWPRTAPRSRHRRVAPPGPPPLGAGAPLGSTASTRSGSRRPGATGPRHAVRCEGRRRRSCAGRSRRVNLQHWLPTAARPTDDELRTSDARSRCYVVGRRKAAPVHVGVAPRLLPEQASEVVDLPVRNTQDRLGTRLGTCHRPRESSRPWSALRNGAVAKSEPGKAACLLVTARVEMGKAPDLPPHGSYIVRCCAGSGLARPAGACARQCPAEIAKKRG